MNRIKLFGTIIVLALACRLPAALPEFDFTTPAGRQGWTAQHDLSALVATPEGLRADISGADPYFAGPARDYPDGQPLWLRVWLHSEVGGVLQVFYFPANGGASEANSVQAAVPSGEWVQVRLAVPPLGANYRLRIDPPGQSGSATFAAVRFEERSALPDFDFRTRPDVTAWEAWHAIAALTPTPEGLKIEIGGDDPYVRGPVRNYPADTPLWMHLRLKSDTAGMAQVFYYQTGPTEEDSVRFDVPAGVWTEVKARCPALGSGYRLRFDPPGDNGNCLVERLWFEPRPEITPPAWPTPLQPQPDESALSVTSAGLRIRHAPGGPGMFQVEVEGQSFAAGYPNALLGYLNNQQARWVALDGASASATVQMVNDRLVAETTLMDPDGGQWSFSQAFRASTGGVIEIETSVTVNTNREVIFLPMLCLLAGTDTFGTNKNQALLSGVEYLENEPSSSEADVRGYGARRLVPDAVKLTFPLMALQAQGRYLGVTWETDSDFAPAFDSPDRQFHSGGHLLGIICPGSDGLNRDEGNLLPYGGRGLAANEPLVLRAKLLGGAGESVVPAIQKYVELHGTITPPTPDLNETNFNQLEANGWLDSAIREENLFRHADASGFVAVPSAEAAVWLDWLAGGVQDTTLSNQLRTLASAAIAAVSPEHYVLSGLGHVWHPTAPLVYGAVAENVNSARTQGEQLLQRFQGPGVILYEAPAAGPDYSQTHWSKEANGLVGGVVARLLEIALLTGDRPLLTNGLLHLRALSKFDRTVPRGAQTWEIPLHTPDVLAAARLVRAYTLGYELTGDITLLDRARYWAWTGVPFVYLDPVTTGPVGVGASIAVLGATGWVAPLWIGLPVQWCGLVYGNALYRLARYDSSGPWTALADSIVASAVQQVYRNDEPARQGLLPDSFTLRLQSRHAPAINPATALSQSWQYFGSRPVYDYQVLRRFGVRVHAAGQLTDLEERSDGFRFTVQGWSTSPHWLLLNGIRQTPQVRINGQAVSLSAPHAYSSSQGWLILQVPTVAEVEVKVPATAWLQIHWNPPATIVLQWPSVASEYFLERAATLDATASWERVSTTPSLDGDWLRWTNDSPGTAFFRLAAPTVNP